MLNIEEVQAFLDGSPFTSLLGLRVVNADFELQQLSVQMPWQSHLERTRGSGRIHGGAITSLVDVVGDFAVGMLVGGAVPTVNLRVDFLRPAAAGDLMATASVRRLGRTLGVVDTEVSDRDGRIAAIGRCTYSTTVG